MIPGKLAFVIQQHHATSMHWDFRLEMDGLLVSWAVPRGPSLDPTARRLAIRVEDHAYSYKDFEGVITGSQYGAGKVIIWDEGVYVPLNAMGDNLYNGWLTGGRLEFILYGQKLGGAWSLFKTTGRRFGENSWLLVKKRDGFAAAGEIVHERPESVRSGKRVDEVTEGDGCLGDCAPPDGGGIGVG